MHGPVANGPDEGAKESGIERLRRALLDPATSLAHYAAAIGVVVLLLSVAWGLHPVLHGRASFLIFIPGVLVAAGFGGIGPGLLATALSVVRQHMTTDPVPITKLRQEYLTSLVNGFVGIPGIDNRSQLGERIGLTRQAIHRNINST